MSFQVFISLIVLYFLHMQNLIQDFTLNLRFTDVLQYKFNRISKSIFKTLSKSAIIAVPGDIERDLDLVNAILGIEHFTFLMLGTTTVLSNQPPTNHLP